MITVPTKQHDGGSTATSAAAAPKFDAFTKYSNNLIRMKELLFLGDDSNEGDDEDLNYLASLNDTLRHASISGEVDDLNNSDASKRRRGNNSRPIPQQGFIDVERKTRLSFELHPSLLLYDLIYQDIDVSAHISDDEDEVDETIVKESS
jgi:hypothetical protein